MCRFWWSTNLSHLQLDADYRALGNNNTQSTLSQACNEHNMGNGGERRIGCTVEIFLVHDLTVTV